MHLIHKINFPTPRQPSLDPVSSTLTGGSCAHAQLSGGEGGGGLGREQSLHCKNLEQVIES